jgi:hypothetical protein
MPHLWHPVLFYVNFLRMPCSTAITTATLDCCRLYLNDTINNPVYCLDFATTTLTVEAGQCVLQDSKTRVVLSTQTLADLGLTIQSLKDAINACACNTLAIDAQSYTAATAAPCRIETDQNTTITAGKVFVRIKHMGHLNDIVDPITVNGDTVSLGGEYLFNAYQNPVSRLFYTSPAFVIVTGGAKIWVDYV